MITKIKLDNFKCFQSLDLSLKPLNVLMGLNGMGKSTILQSLLLLRQSWLDNGLHYLKLNGRYVSLGNGQDILYERAEEETIGFRIVESDKDNHILEIDLKYDYEDSSDLLSFFGKKDIQLLGEDSVLKGERFLYLSASRIEPKKLYEIADEQQLKSRDFGNNGELAIHYLSVEGNKKVSNPSIVFNNTEDATLLNQVIQWLSLISPGIIPQIIVNASLRNAELKYSFREGDDRTNYYKSINVGFGITYILPVIISLLSARSGDLVLIENPEAHIHPAGQRHMGELIAAAASGGVQIIIETHSDHILNGIRLAVKKKKIPAEDTNICYFYKDDSDHYQHKVLFPQINSLGKIDIWPDGFMDEWDHALLELL